MTSVVWTMPGRTRRVQMRRLRSRNVKNLPRGILAPWVAAELSCWEVRLPGGFAEQSLREDLMCF